MTLLLFVCSGAWGDNTPAAAGTYATLKAKKPGGENKFYKLGDGVFLHRKSNSSWDDNKGMKLYQNTNGVAIYLSTPMKIKALVYKKSSKDETVATFNVYTITNGSSTFDLFESGTDNSTTVSVTTAETPSYSFSVTFEALDSKAEGEQSTDEVTIAAGYYYVVGTSESANTFVESVTLTAASTYSVTYKANNGTAEEDVVETVATVGDCPNTFTVPSGKGFAGWNTTAEGDGASYAVGSAVTGTLILYAQWADKYNVIFNSNGGSDVATQNVLSGNTAEEPTDPTRLNYTFLGWQLNGVDYDFDTPVIDNITLDANWSRNTIDEDKVITLVGATPSANKSPLANVVYYNTSYTSGNWSLSGGMGGDISTKNDSRYVGFTIPEGSTATVDVTASGTSGRKIAVVTEADRATSTWTNAFLELNMTGSDVSDTSSELPAGTYRVGSENSGITLKSVVINVTTPAKEVTVKSLGEDDQVIKVTTGETLGNIFPAGTLPTPAVDGYTFNGWKNAADNSAVDNSDEITESMTIYADFTPESATVSATIPESKWGTYCSNYYLDFGDENTEVLAYTVSDFNASTLEITYEKVTGVVPAGIGLLLYAPENGSKAIVTSAEAAVAPTNKLKGFLEATQYNADGDERYLGMSGGSWKVLSAGKIPANKAVLKVTADEVVAINTALSGGAKFTVIINDGEQSETTGISEELRVKSEESSSAYNLAGQKVGKEYKGIVIVNGKKVIRK